MNGNIIRLNLGITKTYLLPCHEGYLLIDTGYNNKYTRFLQALKKHNINKNQISYILLTHAHDDHVGFAQKLKSDLNVPIIVHKNAIPFLIRGSNEDDKSKPVNKRINIIMSLYSWFHRGFSFQPVQITNRDLIVNGDNREILKSIGVSGVILHTPGHTKDSISVVLDEGQVFCGDTAMNFLKFTGVGNRPIYINDEKAVYNSWEKIMHNGAKSIYPAHGNPFAAQKLEKRY